MDPCAWSESVWGAVARCAAQTWLSGGGFSGVIGCGWPADVVWTASLYLRAASASEREHGVRGAVTSGKEVVWRLDAEYDSCSGSCGAMYFVGSGFGDLGLLLVFFFS